jgi:hypothetical protein
MVPERKSIVAVMALIALASVSLLAQAAPSKPAAISLGTVKLISGNLITLTTDAGTEVNVSIEPDAKFLRTAPGHKDLQGATPIQLPDVQTGDRMLARGKLADDGKTVMATSVIVMKRADIAQKQQQEQQDWRTHGVSGVVKSVDLVSKVITVSTGTLTSKPVAIHISNDTILRRYSPDSVKFDDAKVGTLDQVQPGDQLRARGDRNADGSELTAKEIVSGTFRNIAGTVVSTDASSNTVTISDLLSKKPVIVKIGSDSQLHQLPPMMASGIAARLKGDSGGPPGVVSASPHQGSAEGAGHPEGAQGNWRRPEGTGGQSRGDLQQMLNRMPAITIADLHKGDAVILVTTEGSKDSQPTAITLLTGVEPILTAAPDQAAMSLSPWSLSAPAAEDAGP